MKTLHFQSTIVESEKINPLFTKVKIHVAYDGENRNGSYISRETFDKAALSAMFCPIIGEWSESTEDFEGHGGKLEIKDNSIEFVNTTIPYGCISNEEPTWETIIDDNGESKDYFTLTGYVWSSRYPELESLIENNQKGHSMEIEIINGNYQTIDGQKIYAITDMVFSGFCILGDDVEPCFENSTISTYSLDKDKFKQEFKQMMNELKFSLELVEKNNSVQEGGKKMEELQLLLDKYGLKLEDLTSKEINHEEFSLEELEVKIQEVFKQEEPKVLAGDPPVGEEFTLTSEQLEDELKRELSEIEMIQDDYWEDMSYPRFNFVDYMPEQSVVVAYDYKEGILVGFNYALINENVEVDAASAVRYKVEFVPMNLAGDTDNDSEVDVFSKHFTSHSQVERQVKVKESELTKQFEAEKVTAQDTLDKAYADFAKLQEEFSKLEESAKELEEFKLNHVQQERENAENELFERFVSGFGLTEDDLVSIKEKKSEFSIAELEDKLFAIAGRKKLSYSKTNTETKPIRYNLPIDTPKSDKEYADLIEKHKNK